MRNRVVVETKSQIPDLSGIKGVHDLSVSHGVNTFNADGDEMGNIMSEISKYDIMKIEATPPTLEDMFMSHYEGDGGER